MKIEEICGSVGVSCHLSKLASWGKIVRFVVHPALRLVNRLWHAMWYISIEGQSFPGNGKSVYGWHHTEAVFWDVAHLFRSFARLFEACSLKR